MDNHKIFFRISGIETLAAGFYLLAIGIFPAHKIQDFELIWEGLLPSVVLALGILLNFVILMVFAGIEKGFFLSADLRPARPIIRIWLILLAVSGIMVVVIWSTRFGIIPPITRY